MKLRNFWLNKSNEKNILKVLEWSHRQGITVEKITISDIIEAVKSHLRDPFHS